jgi:hypothetical protein
MADHDFELFWQAYPRRIAKGDARKAFAQAMRVTTIEEILMALAWQVHQPAWTRDNGDYIPHPASYLRAERWTDEPYENPKRSPAAVAELKAFKEAMQRKRESA